jgi:hypothetical protein
LALPPGAGGSFSLAIWASVSVLTAHRNRLSGYADERT